MPARDTPTTRAIAEAAEALFTRDGFAGASVRAIAAEAGVDPALVIRHYGSKIDLFLETMRWRLDSESMFAGPIEHLGGSIIRRLLAADDAAAGVYLALLRASADGKVSRTLERVHEDEFVAPLRERLEGEDADARARLAAALVGGLLYLIWVVGDTVAAEDPEALTARYGALLQELITPR